MDGSIYRLRLRDLLVLTVLSLLLLGVLMVQSASTRLDALSGDGWDWTSAGMKQMALAAGALIVFFGVGLSDYRLLSRRPTVSWGNPLCCFFAITILLCAATLIPGVGHSVNGARRWLVLGPIQVQPSELAKWSVVLVLAWVLAYDERVRERFGRFLLLCLVVAVPCLLIVVQDFGTAALIGLVALLMMVVGRVKLWHIAVLLPPVLLVGTWFIVHKSYRLKRMTSFLNPFEDSRGEGYHMVQSLLSFSSGGVLGRGLGNGVQKLGYLPEDTTDFIFAVVCEELGLFGALLTIVLFLGIGFVGWQVMKGRDTTPAGVAVTCDPFARLLVFGVTVMVCMQAMINVAVATVSVPTKGMSLPLVSAGGSGLLITAAALGLIYSVARLQEREGEELPLAAVPG
jgi:cell division protein FtsW